MGNDAEQVADDLRTVAGHQTGRHELAEPVGVMVTAEVAVAPEVLLGTQQEFSHLTGVDLIERTDAQLLEFRWFRQRPWRLLK
jgi:hypothetical protein